MQVSIFGLGYVGTVCAACLSDLGHNVIGVDANPTKVDLLRGGQAPIVERDIDKLVEAAVRHGRLTATTDVERAIMGSDLSLICVGTPSRPNGSLDTRAAETVAGQIGRAIADKNEYHSVVVRSTLLPGTIRGRILPILEEAARGRVGEKFGLASNPEFMREGTAVADFRNPSKTVIGEIDPQTADTVTTLYTGLPGVLFRTPVEIAEMVKYADNVWHALKVSFANEIGSICKVAGIDSHALMEIFCADKKLNISRAYLQPGFAFGGSCLPKDARALAYFAASKDLNLPLISNLLASNRQQIERGVKWILATGAKRIAFLGLSFKAGTDDLRESPYVDVIERLIGKGRLIRIFDQNVELARLIGANRDFLYGVIPHIAGLMVDSIDDAIAGAEVVVATVNAPEYSAVVERLRPEQILLDFTRLSGVESRGSQYDGFLW
jgi:GDP-mannose 6-dehydrogenase